MKVAVCGAGFSGISTVKILREFGHDVTVFESEPDIGGVWSSSRRYPGLHTQNTSDTYCLSDLAMPRSYPAWPSSEQVQAYLESYCKKNDLLPHIKLDTEVIRVSRAGVSEDSLKGTGWEVETRRVSTGEKQPTEHFDHFVVANGIFCKGDIPNYPGTKEFKDAGGKVLHSCQLGSMDHIRNRNVIVVGYGKSACDVAYAVSEMDMAKTTTVVCRRLIWKLPRKIRGLTYKWLLLTRFGEALFRYIEPSSALERFFHGPSIGRTIRNTIIGSLEWVIKGQLNLDKLKLLPPGGFETIARSTISLSTEGFYDKVGDGRIKVKRDRFIAKLGKEEGSDRLGATLDDGTFLPAEVIVCGTGYLQKPPAFLPEDVQKSLTDDAGNFLLYRHIKPLYVDDLTFNGYNSSLFCATSSEAASMWIATYLAEGQAMLPPLNEQVEQTKTKMAWLDERSGGKHAHGTNLVPFSLHSIDDTLEEIGVNLSVWQRLYQWIFPVDPTSYASCLPKLKRRLKVE